MASSNADVDMTQAPSNANSSASRTNGSTSSAQPQQPHVHAKSGYTYVDEEDAPGYGWRSKKGQDEMNKAWELVEEPHETISDKYPDPALIAPQGTPWENIK